MSLRVLFATLAVACAAGAVLIGGVLAWRTSDSARGAALVGSNRFEIRYEPNCPRPIPLPNDVTLPADEADTDPSPVPCLTLIGPNGSRTLVGKGVARNLGDFRLRVTGGSLRVTHVLSRDPVAAAEARPCGVDDFAGGVEITGDPNLPPGGSGGEFAAFLGVLRGAPPSCQGDVVVYRVTVEAENPLPSPEDAASDAEPAAR